MKPFFVFSGQGAQSVGMGRDLYEQSAASRAIFERADAELNFALSDVIFNGPQEKLTQTRYCQTAIYTMSCAALAAFQEKFPEAKPVACAGLSLGEYAAFYAAGAFDFVTGLRLLQQRAELMDAACQEAAGGMASVLGGDLAVIREVCQLVDIDIANYNNPGQIVISGPKDRVDQAVAELKARGMRKVIPLTVAGAFHSRMMKTAGEGLTKVLASTEIKMPQVPVFQNFTAQQPSDVAELKANLASQVAGSVRWEECMRNGFAAGAEVMIEFGPGAVLTGLLRRTIKDAKYCNINSVETLAAAEF